MSAEHKRLSLADTLRATSPIAGAALASTASAIRLISAPQEAMPEAAPAGSHALPENPHSKGKPVIRPLIRPVSQPLSQSLSQSQDHSASHSASQSSDRSQDPSLSQSLSQSRVADRLTKSQRAVLSHLLATRPYIIQFAQLGQAVGLGEATTRTILRRLATLDFIKYQRQRDGQIQGVSISFNASLCEQFTQGQSLSQSLDQPVTKPLSRPLTSKKMDLNQDKEIYPSEDEPGERLLRLSDETFAEHWPDVFAIGFGTDEIRRVVESRRAVGKSNNRLVEGLDHADFALREQREGHRVIRDGEGEEVRKLAGYVLNSLRKSGTYGMPDGYVSPEEQAEKDAVKKARRIMEARKAREEAEFQVWRGGLTPEEREAILKSKLPGTADSKLIYAWRKQVEETNTRQVRPVTPHAEMIET